MQQEGLHHDMFCLGFSFCLASKGVLLQRGHWVYDDGWIEGKTKRGGYDHHYLFFFVSVSSKKLLDGVWLDIFINIYQRAAFRYDIWDGLVFFLLLFSNRGPRQPTLHSVRLCGSVHLFKVLCVGSGYTILGVGVAICHLSAEDRRKGAQAWGWHGMGVYTTTARPTVIDVSRKRNLHSAY